MTSSDYIPGTSALVDHLLSIEDIGAEIIECKPGDVFDAEVHEAIGVVHEGKKDGTVATVVQNGYRLGDIIVRPARVIVNKVSNNKDE